MKTSLLAFVIAVTAFPAHAGDIVALCIGNNAYVNPEDVLDTPVADAELMQRTLWAVPGVAAEDVVLLRNAKRSEITLALRQLKARSKAAKLCLVFYSGHGVEDTPTGFDRAETFLLPVDAEIESADELPDEAVPLHVILDGLGAEGGAKAVILDCCRTGAPSATKSLRRAGKDVSAIDDNVKRALGNAVLPEGTLIAFAASPGRKAAAFLKETDTNSPFTYFIAEEMSRQGRDLLSIINTASTITKEKTEMRQVPHVELRGDVSLIMNVAIPAARPGAVVSVPIPITNSPKPITPPIAPFEGTSAGEIKLIGGVEMVWCPPGTFLMGSPAAEEEHVYNETQRRVTLLQGFWLAKTECTQAQWKAVMGTSPSHFEGTRLPVELVSWEDSMAWCGKMNASAHELPTGWTWTLPTEAQWEYACRAETTGPYAGTSLDALGWYSDNSGSSTHAVATKKPNPWGLYDMHGNVWEWCSDWYYKDSFRVNRGGSWWDSNARYCRSAYRGRGSPDNRLDYLGFRPAVSLP
jgi:hypothetical protein